MPDAIITSTESTFGTISGTFAADQSTISGTVTGIVAGTLSGSVGVPGPAGAPGAPGVGVPAGGTSGQFLQKTSGTDYATDWVTVNLAAYAVKANNLSDLTNFATARDNLSLGSSSTPTFAGVNIPGSGTSVANLGSTSLTINQSGHGQFTIQPSQGIVFPNGTIQTTAFTGVPADYITSVSSPLTVTAGNLSIDLSAYLTSATAASTYYPLTNPSGFITASALTPYLTTSAAASTYQTLAGMSSYLTTSAAASTYQTLAGMSAYLTTASAATSYYPLTGNPSGFLTSAPVTSVAGRTGAITLSNTDISGLGTLAVVNDAPSDGSQYARKNGAWDIVSAGASYISSVSSPLSVTSGNLSIDLSPYAPLASPVFTGDARAVTPTFGDNDTSVATTAFVQSALLGGTAVARNLEVEVRNQSGSTIAAGSIVYISGATGNKPLITLAQANNDANSAQTIGFVKTAIANNGTGYVIVRGELENIDTSALTEGVQLYLSPTTAGTWTTTKPSAPQHLVYVGIVIRSHPTLGTILVAVQNGYELGEIHDVAIGTLANNDLLAYESSTDLWKNKTAADLGLATLASPALTGNVSIVSNSSVAALFIEQQGTGNILTLHDQASDTTFVAIDQNGKVNTIPSDATNGAGFNVAHGTAPTTPVNGDIWTTTSGLFMRQNGTSRQYVDFDGTQTINGNKTFSNALLVFGNSTATSTTSIASGATISGSTKTVNIGTGGVSGSTTNVNIATGSGGLTTIAGTTSFTGGTSTFSGSSLTLGNSTGASTYNLGTGATTASTTKVVSVGTAGVLNSVTNIAIGPDAGFSTITVGPSTANSTLNLGNGATTSASIKAVNIGTSGVAGSTTNIAIGSTTGTSTTTLQGTTNGVTAAADTNSVALATTAYVVGQAGSATPLVNGTAAVGTSLRYARQDHVHPTDTSRAALSGATFTGLVSTPASATGSSGFRIVPGVAPTTPNNGDLWATTTDLQVRLNGVTETVAEQSWVTAQGYITSSALTPYLTSATAASTYQTISGMSSYLTTASAASTYAPLASPALTGVPTAPTAANGTNTTQVATTAFVLANGGAVTSVAGRTGAVTLAVADVSGAAPLASPALTGTPTAPTAATSTNTTQVATTAYVVGQAGTATPLANNTAAVGTSLLYSRQDHVHPTDTTRAPLASPTFTGTVTIPAGASISGFAPLASPTFTGTPSLPTGTTAVTQTAGNNTTAVATTAFVTAAIPTNNVKAWVNFNGGGTPSIRASLNVSSITDNAVGDFTVNMTTALADANFSMVGSCSIDSSTTGFAFVSAFGSSVTPFYQAPTTSTARFTTPYSANVNLRIDPVYCNVAILR